MLIVAPHTHQYDMRESPADQGGAQVSAVNLGNQNHNAASTSGGSKERNSRLSAPSSLWAAA
jgi:hypothetical protein